MKFNCAHLHFDDRAHKIELMVGKIESNPILNGLTTFFRNWTLWPCLHETGSLGQSQTGMKIEIVSVLTSDRYENQKRAQAFSARI